MIGIFYLLNTDRVDLLAITTTSNGMSHYRYGTYPRSWREKADTVNSIKLPFNIEDPKGLDSVDFLIETIKTYEKKITILCTGPLTNLASALIKEPRIKKNIERIYVIGGAINVRGNLIGKHNG